MCVCIYIYIYTYISPFGKICCPNSRAVGGMMKECGGREDIRDHVCGLSGQVVFVLGGFSLSHILSLRILKS